jgi:hypothetical protein
MRDELTKRGVNTEVNGISGITLFNGRVIRHSNVSISTLVVLDK